jgi:hypothetical protein
MQLASGPEVKPDTTLRSSPQYVLLGEFIPASSRGCKSFDLISATCECELSLERAFAESSESSDKRWRLRSPLLQRTGNLIS